MDLTIHPLYSNNPDSTWFQKRERENSAYSQFLNENDKWKASLGVLQNFLLNYDDTESDFYKSGIEEYELRRNNYNEWLTTESKRNRKLFVSRLFGFEYVPEISGAEASKIEI